MKVLVTGGNGYIGSHLVEKLLSDGISVRALVYPGTDESMLGGCEVVRGDIMDPASLGPACDGVGQVFHLAAIVTDWGHSKKFDEINYTGTMNIARAAARAGATRFMFMSSLTVHGFGNHVRATEETPIDPVPFFPYSAAKARAEEGLLGLHDEGAIDITIIRPGFDIVGERNFTSSYKMLKSIEKGQFGYLDGGTSLICLVYVKNLVAAMVHLATHPPAAGEAYVVSDVSWTWREYVQAICDRLGCKEPKLDMPSWLVSGPVRLVEWLYKVFKSKNPPVLTRYRISVPRWNIDFVSTKLASTGFVAPVSFEVGLDRTIEWYQKVRQSTAD